MTKKRTQEELDTLLLKAIEEVENCGLDVGVITPRLEIMDSARTFGRCTRTPMGFNIAISKYIMNTNEQELKDTLVHEVLHTVEGCMNHGPNWKRAAEIVNEEYGYNIQRTSQRSMESLSQAHQAVLKRHTVQCVKCGAQIHRQVRSKLVKKPELYSCGGCGGGLKNV